MADIRYSIKYNRMKTAYIEGFQASEDGVLKSTPSLHNFVFFRPIDTAVMDNTFGRLRFDMEADGNVTLSVYVAASNEQKMPMFEESVAKNKSILTELGAIRYNDINDILLYSLSGRYLYLAFELNGEGQVSVSNIKVYHRGDNFMNTFPEVYHERDSFFHRFMSTFSSVYNDMEEEIENLPKLLNLDTCDASLLPIYGRWLGIDVGDGFLKEDVLRTLVKESYMLNKMKGSRYCLERISEIILGKKGIIVERNSAQDYLSESEIEQFNLLYGSNISDVTLLIKQELDTITLSQLEYIMEQFLPINCSLHIVKLQDGISLDGYVYLDINASVYKAGEGTLDESYGLDGNAILS